MTVAENTREIIELKDISKKITKFLFGNGDDSIGLDETMRKTDERLKAVEARMNALENAQGITNSELNHLRNVYFREEGLDAMGNKIKKTWIDSAWDRIKKRFVDAVFMAILILVLSDIPSFIARIIEYYLQ